MRHISKDGTIYERQGSGPSVVLIHGLGLNQKMWQWLLPDLVPYFDVISFDLFGHGESPAPPSQPSLALFSGQILTILETINIDVAAIVGFSLGGMIARRFAYDYSKVTSAIAILHSPHNRTQLQRNAVLERVQQAERCGPGATIEPALKRWFTPNYRLSHPEIMNLIRKWILSNDTLIYSENYRVLAERDEELIEIIQNINCPTFIMTGQNDDGNSPNMASDMAKAIVGAQLKILPNLKHMALAEAPNQFNPPLVSFLKTVLKA